MKENKRILYNAIKTPDGTILVSKHRHDYNLYIDKNGKFYAVDGGLDYLKRSFDVNDYIDLSVYDDGKHETRRKYLEWGSNYDKDMNKLPRTIFRPIQKLDTDHIKSILDGGFVDNNPFYKQIFEDELKYRKTEKNK